MSLRSAAWRYRLLLALPALALAACGPAKPSRPPIAPVVAGLGDPRLSSRDRGMVLLGELGCVQCHADEKANPASARRGPNLSGVGARVHADYLVRFLADPHATDPGTTMPAMLFDRSQSEREDAAAALSDYLRSFTPEEVASAPIDRDAAANGKALFHQVGCAACHAPRDEQDREIALPDSVSLSNVAAKYPPAALRAFLLAPHDVRPDSRMPDLHLSPTEAHELTSYLLLAASPAAPAKAPDPARVERGRTLFAERQCAACHALPDERRAPTAAQTPLRKLKNLRAGCLSDGVGAWPFLELSEGQRSDLTAALQSLDAATTDEQQIHQLLASRHCTACHARGESGGVTTERSSYFTTRDPSMGMEARIPPPLTGIGAKLQPAWLRDAIAHGQAIRPYLHTRMPGFGDAIATALSALVERTDTLPPLALPKFPDDDKKQREIRDLGWELVGDKGMNCISCHAFAGEKVGMMAAVDLIDSTAERLRREWFHHFLRAPYDFKQGTLMPQFFVGGVSSRPNLGGGDVMQQIDGIWHYLAEGRNTRQPSGMRHPAIELKVDLETVLLRRSAQRTGKRGISVGYPGGVNLTFDAETIGLNQIWWGKFANASGVFYGQGSGEVHPMSQQLVELPKGPAFVQLGNQDAPWPAATRRELGHEWLGYDLDAQQSPTFRYRCEGVTITDTPSVLKENQERPTLRRTLTFASDKDPTLHFRAARAERIEELSSDLGTSEIAVGPSLRMRLPSGAFRIRAAAKERELIVTIPLKQGAAQLVVDYRFQEGK